ncbi:hypothetical protein JHK85_023235 [Glycine max]|nr:hypothetical protein JHK85_023235 [Glycine max]
MLLIERKVHRGSPREFRIHPRNIERLPKPSLNTLDINFVNLPLPKVQNLPENAEANTDIPYDVFEHLKEAYDVLQEPLKRFLESSKPD